MKQVYKVLLMSCLLLNCWTYNNATITGASQIKVSSSVEKVTMNVGEVYMLKHSNTNIDGIGFLAYFEHNREFEIIGDQVVIADPLEVSLGEQIAGNGYTYNDWCSTVTGYVPIVAVKPGKCIVIEQLYQNNGDNLFAVNLYRIAIRRIEITVNGSEPQSMVMQHQLHLEVGKTHTLSPRLLPSGTSTTYTWYSSNTSVATVSSAGVITANAVGDVTITCITANGLREDCNVTVTPRLVSSISLNQQELRMNVGDRYQFSPVISPTNATYQQVTWQSLKPDVVTVNENGMASCLSNGQAVILATTIDGSNLTAASFVQVGDNCDVNGDGNVSISDVSELISCLLNGGESASNTTTYTVGGVNFTMVNVEGGTFTMGATAEQGNDAYDREKPAHQVTLSSYSIGQTEVTQALWYAVMGSNPSDFTGNQQCPVEMVSWDECQQFITRLNALTGKNFRLPTEAEWEFAARGGNTSQGTKYSGSNDLNEVGWYMDNSNNTTHAVATKSPNELGLYDMSGNVLELCQDWYSDSYSSGAQTNPTGPSSGTQRVIRGGSYKTSPNTCRVSFRYPQTPTQKFSNVGFRLAL